MILKTLHRFYFDFSMTYIGAGMICSHIVNLSLLFGAVLSWGIMWPLIKGLSGDWYPSTLPQSSMKSLNGYKVFVSISLILGDGLYHFIKILMFTARNIYSKLKNHHSGKSSKYIYKLLYSLLYSYFVSDWRYYRRFGERQTIYCRSEKR